MKNLQDTPVRPSAPWTTTRSPRLASPSLSGSCRASTKGTYGLVIPPRLERSGAFVFQAGGKLVSDDGARVALNSAEGQQALEFYYGLCKDGTASTPADTGTQWPGDAFSKRKAAIVFEGNWMFPFLQKEAPDLKYGIAEMPSGPKGKGTFVFTVSYSAHRRVTKSSRS